MEGPEGENVWTETHRQQLQQGNVSDPPARRHNAVVPKLAHPASAFLVCSPSSPSASFPTSALAALQSLSCCLPLGVCVCVCLHSAVCVCLCVHVGVMMQQAEVVQPWQQKDHLDS